MRNDLPPRLQKQFYLEEMFSKNQLNKRIRAEFINSEDFNFVEYLEIQKIPTAFGIDVLTQMVLHKRADLPTLVGSLRHHFNDSQLAADTLYKMAQADLVDYDTSLRQFIIIYDISDDVQAELDLFQFPLPMVIEPLPVLSNKDTGYLLSGGSIILKDNHHDDDVCLDHINRMNKVVFCINTDTATMIKNRWRGLDKKKQGETHDDFRKRKRAFEKYDRTAKDVIDILVKEGNEFNLTHRYDKRGRVYCMGYHVTYQGATWNKAVIELADKELLT